MEIKPGLSTRGMSVNPISAGNCMVVTRGRNNNRMCKLCLSVGIAFLALVNTSAFAVDSEDLIKIRPQAGIGILDDDKSYHAGLRFLFKASGDKKYGWELTRMFNSKSEYIVFGVILEKKQFGWLNLAFGTVGYFGQGSGTKNLPGLLLNVGWEPDTTSAIKPYVTVRYDDIVADKIIVGTSVSAGLSIIY